VSRVIKRKFTEKPTPPFWGLILYVVGFACVGDIRARSRQKIKVKGGKTPGADAPPSLKKRVKVKVKRNSLDLCP
jgi:hypothetical protein